MTISTRIPESSIVDTTIHKGLESITESQTFSNSRISAYLKCPAMYYLKYVRNLASGRQNDALLYGSIVHKMIEAFFLTYIETNNEDESYLKAKHTMMTLYAVSGIDHDIKTSETGLKFMKDLISFKLHLRGKLEPEKEMTIKNFLPNIDLMGIKDLTIVTDKTKEVYDFKTTSIMGGYYYSKQEMNRQYKTYAFVTGTLTFYLVALHCKTAPVTNAPYLMPFSQQDIDLWEMETKGIISAILNRERQLGKVHVNRLFPRHCTECVEGRYGCGYTSICSQGNLDTDNIEGFVKRKDRKEEKSKQEKLNGVMDLGL